MCHCLSRPLCTFSLSLSVSCHKSHSRSLLQYQWTKKQLSWITQLTQLTTIIIMRKRSNVPRRPDYHRNDANNTKDGKKSCLIIRHCNFYRHVKSNNPTLALASSSLSWSTPSKEQDLHLQMKCHLSRSFLLSSLICMNMM